MQASNCKVEYSEFKETIKLVNQKNSVVNQNIKDLTEVRDVLVNIKKMNDRGKLSNKICTIAYFTTGALMTAAVVTSAVALAVFHILNPVSLPTALVIIVPTIGASILTAPLFCAGDCSNRFGKKYYSRGMGSYQLSAYIQKIQKDENWSKDKKLKISNLFSKHLEIDLKSLVPFTYWQSDDLIKIIDDKIAKAEIESRNYGNIKLFGQTDGLPQDTLAIINGFSLKLMES